MTKKPIFVSSDSGSDGASETIKDAAAQTRLYRDPAEAPASESHSTAPNPTRILGERPAITEPDSPESVTRLVDDQQTALASDVTRVISDEQDHSEHDALSTTHRSSTPVVGWLIVIDGPGRGTSVPFGAGMNSIGRRPDNGVVLDFGDEDITESAHAFIVYDEENKAFHVTHAGQQSVVRLNDQPLLEAKPIDDGGLLRLGQTTVRFCALCGPDFDWSDS
jgi:hypothetical protein